MCHLTEPRSAEGMIIDAAGERSEQGCFLSKRLRQHQRGVRRPGAASSPAKGGSHHCACERQGGKPAPESVVGETRNQSSYVGHDSRKIRMRGYMPVEARAVFVAPSRTTFGERDQRSCFVENQVNVTATAYSGYDLASSGRIAIRPVDHLNKERPSRE